MKDFNKISCLILLILFPNVLIYSQTEQYKFRHLTTENGLSCDNVNTIFKDSRGFIWIGTKDGLNCYDGYEVRIFRNNPNDSTSISDNNILAINEDISGDLLIGTSTWGLNRFDFATEEFTTFRTFPASVKIDNIHRVNVITKDTGNVFWIGTNVGLIEYESTSGKFTKYMIDPDSLSSSVNSVQAILAEIPNRIWVGTANGLFHFDPKTSVFVKIHLQPDYSYPLYKQYEQVVNCISQDDESIIWIGTNWYFYRYDQGTMDWIGPKGLYVDKSTPNSIFIHSIDKQSINDNEIIWLATFGGLNRFDIDSHEFIHLMPEVENSFSISSYALTTQFMDETGLLWIGHRDNGVDIVNLNENRFYRPIIRESGAYGGYASSFLVDSKGYVWIGIGDDGLLQLNQRMNFISYFKFRLPGGKEQQNCNIHHIFEDKNGNIWIGNDLHMDGLFIFNREKRDFTPINLPIPDYYSQPSTLEKVLFNSFMESRKGDLWLGTSHGLYRNEPGKETEFCPVELTIQNTPVPIFIWDLLEDSKGNLWIATNEHGLYCQRNTNSSLRNSEYWKIENMKHMEFQGSIMAILEDHMGILWFGTSEGLFMLHPADTSLQSVGKQHILLFGNPIYDMVEDNFFNLWMNTKKGLVRYCSDSTKGVLARMFKKSDGLPFDDLNQRAFYQSKDGRIFIGGPPATDEGFFYFYPDRIEDNNHIPPVFITKINIRNKSMSFDSSIFVKKNLQLKHDQNFFSIEFAALDYITPDQNQYAYYLDGFEDNWDFCGNRRIAFYTGVPPGRYIFHVKGSNNNGYWNEAGTSLAITILPPHWKTWWAYAIYFIIFIAVIYSIIHYYLRRQRLLSNLALEQFESEKLKELDTLKTKFFTNISHEFRTPLTLILGPIQQLITKVNDPSDKRALSMVLQSAHRLKDLVNQLLSLSKLESGKMRLHSTELNIIEFVRNYVQSFESLAKHDNIELVFTSSEKELNAFIDKEKISQVLNNLLSNAFKFTDEDGKVEVSITPLPPSRGVTIKVADTGRGIPPEKLEHIFNRFYQADDSISREKEGTGIGLAIVKEMVNLHHGKIEVESKVGKGATFTIYLPLDNTFLKPDEIKSLKDSETDIVHAKHILKKTDKRKIIDSAPTEEHETESQPILLIVEDNRDMRTFIRGFFDEDFKILEACDGEDGLTIAINNIPDIIISDVMMRRMDGYEFCQKIKTDEKTSHIPVILLTARASKESRMEGLETGADDFITKPFDGEELQVRVKNLIDQRKKLSEHYRKDYEVIQVNVKEKFLTLDEKFLQKAKRIVEKNLSNPEYDVEDFASDMALSRVQLYRKFRALVNQSVTEFIRTIRLNYAIRLLKKRTGTISEIAYDAGFNNPTYFSIAFKKQYGISPSEYINQTKNT